MMEKRCVDCGIIFLTDEPEKERCDLCEDDRREEEDADSEYEKNWYRIRRYGRRYVNTPTGVIHTIFGGLLRLMNWVNETWIRGCD